jgi:hypothetical protein
MYVRCYLQGSENGQVVTIGKVGDDLTDVPSFWPYVNTRMSYRRTFVLTLRKHEDVLTDVPWFWPYVKTGMT